MILHIEDNDVRNLLFKGEFGLERENLRATKGGRLAKTRHPFHDHPHITMDFAENQVEINTPVFSSAEEVIESLKSYSDEVNRILASRDEKEYLWPFSNPPYIESEDDIPIAQFFGKLEEKTRYREYLSERYGRYKMTFCGVHVNYSFAEELLQADYRASQAFNKCDFSNYKNLFYLSLAERVVKYCWLITALTAASPLVDKSFIDHGHQGGSVFTGMASMRCGENGYWNSFTPIFEYDSMEAYTNRIKYYVDMGLIISPSELYYPVRLKPRGDYSLSQLLEEGVNHIELRLFDLNPLCEGGVDVRDIKFVQLLLIYLAGVEDALLEPKDQIQAIQNMKNAACYDHNNIKIVMPDQSVIPLAEAGQEVIAKMCEFFEDCIGKSEAIETILSFEEEKLIDQNKSYAHILREKLGDEYVKNGCKMMQ